MNITLPYNWKPRPYQLPLFGYIEQGGKRAVIRWHRRAGKDEVCLHIMACLLFQRVGNYWHLLPEYAQARKAIWNAVNPHTGKRRIDEAFPVELRKRTVDDQMLIEFVNGSTWQLVGSDRYDALVGAPPVGIVFSEYALSNPAAWDYLRPMLLENGGVAIFNSTVRGRNHFWELGEYAKESPDWFFQQLNADQSGVFTHEQLERERAEMIATKGDDEGESTFRQEYFNDPAAAIPGAYYGKLLMRAQDEGRITSVPWEPSIPVATAWDLGIGDSTAIWFAQCVGKEVRIIDHYEASGVGLEHYAKILAEKPYTYYDTMLPHDADVSELGTGKRRIDTLKELGVPKLRVLPRNSIEDGISAARLLLPRCWFDEKKCAKGLSALHQYQREYDEKLHDFKQKPRHDWTSHSADAFRYLAMGLKPLRDRSNQPRFANSDYNVFS